MVKKMEPADIVTDKKVMDIFSTSDANEEVLPEPIVDASLDKINGRLDKMAKAFGELSKKTEDIDSRTIASKPANVFTLRPQQSSTTGKLALALSKAQKEMGLARPTGSNGRGGASATLEDLLETAVPYLEANELSVMFLPWCTDLEQEVVTIRLTHSSNEYCETTNMLFADASDAKMDFQQKRTSALTYTMKNMYRALLCMGSE